MGIERVERFRAQCNFYDPEGPKVGGVRPACYETGPLHDTPQTALAAAIEAGWVQDRAADDDEMTIVYCPEHSGVAENPITKFTGTIQIQ